MYTKIYIYIVHAIPLNCFATVIVAAAAGAFFCWLYSCESASIGLASDPNTPVHIEPSNCTEATTENSLLHFVLRFSKPFLFYKLFYVYPTHPKFRSPKSKTGNFLLQFFLSFPSNFHTNQNFTISTCIFQTFSSENFIWNSTNLRFFYIFVNQSIRQIYFTLSKLPPLLPLKKTKAKKKNRNKISRTHTHYICVNSNGFIKALSFLQLSRFF